MTAATTTATATATATTTDTSTVTLPDMLRASMRKIRPERVIPELMKRLRETEERLQEAGLDLDAEKSAAAVANAQQIFRGEDIIVSVDQQRAEAKRAALLALKAAIEAELKQADWWPAVEHYRTFAQSLIDRAHDRQRKVAAQLVAIGRTLGTPSEVLAKAVFNCLVELESFETELADWEAAMVAAQKELPRNVVYDQIMLLPPVCPRKSYFAGGNKCRLPLAEVAKVVAAMQP